MASNLRSVSVSVMYGLSSVEPVPEALSVISVISCVPLVASVSLRRRGCVTLPPATLLCKLCLFTLLPMPPNLIKDRTLSM